MLELIVMSFTGDVIKFLVVTFAGITYSLLVSSTHLIPLEKIHKCNRYHNYIFLYSNILHIILNLSTFK